MSLLRLILWSGLIGGWAAFFGWLFAELILHLWIDNFFVGIVMATLVAIPIGGGICLASGLTNPQFNTLAKRLGLGFAGGLIGGLIGAVLGSCIFGGFGLVSTAGFIEFAARVIGFTFIGIGIGAGVGLSEGIFDRSFNKLRNGLIGGIIGGTGGGIIFGVINLLGGSITGRAVAFVLLGMAIGLAIGLAQVMLKEAWLTVEGGFRPGRQMILGSDQVTMGTSEKSSLIFIAYGAKGVEPTHLKISKSADGRYLVEDNQSRTGTLLNGKPVSAATVLVDGDAIQFGVNVVRFNERVKRSGHDKLPPPVVAEAPKPATPAAAITAKQPALAPTGAVQVTKPAPVAPAPKASPAPPKPMEARCPICDQAIVGIPGARRCVKCFTTF